jgi:hypothetical protein
MASGEQAPAHNAAARVPNDIFFSLFPNALSLFDRRDFAIKKTDSF